MIYTHLLTYSYVIMLQYIGIYNIISNRLPVFTFIAILFFSASLLDVLLLLYATAAAHPSQLSAA